MKNTDKDWIFSLSIWCVLFIYRFDILILLN